MLFPTYEFLGFFFLVFGIGIFLKQQVTAYKYFLVLASLVFYSFWSLKFLSLLVIDTIINYIILQSITRSQQKNFFFTLGLVINLLYLVFFKYENFFVDSLFEFLHLIHLQSHFQVVQIIAPIGISFYTFRIIAHLVDCYKNQLDCPPLLDYAVYVTYFPQIASGPIARAQEFYAQLNSREKYNYQIEYVIILIISGLFKKYTLSSFLFNFTQLPFSLPEQYSSFDLILAAVAYSCLIYVDFSGYSDLANAISSLLGFKPIPNFNMPYRSLSVQEFWRRWHISLSEWLRDYLYISLGGNRKGQLRKYFNLMLTMVIGGFWHGAGVNFIIWGGLHGVGLIINHLWKDLGKIISAKNTVREEKEKNFYFRVYKKLSSQNWIVIRLENLWKILTSIFYWLLTFSFLTVTWIFFNTPNYDSAMKFINRIFDFNSGVSLVQFHVWQLYIVFFIVFMMNFAGDKMTEIFCKFLSKQYLVLQTVIVACLVYIILRLGPDTVPPFIYFNF